MRIVYLIFVFLLNNYETNSKTKSGFVSSILKIKQENQNWFSYAGKTYYVDTIFQANFYRAMQFCRQQKMHLLSINSQIENNRIGKFLIDNGLQHGHYWTSATNLGGAGEWIWLSTGHNIVYTNWYPGEPSGKSNTNASENCIEVRYWGQSGFTWNDLPCHYNALFICESIDEDCVKVKSPKLKLWSLNLKLLN